jgi:hypothetical protein
VYIAVWVAARRGDASHLGKEGAGAMREVTLPHTTQ